MRLILATAVIIAIGFAIGLSNDKDKADVGARTGEQVPRQVIATGGHTGGSSANFRLSGTAGQVAAGAGSSSNFGVSDGFWQDTEEGGVNQDYLFYADFENKSADQPIGTGGAASNEPCRLLPSGCNDGYVRNIPTPTRSLELKAKAGCEGTSAWADFCFQEDAIITEGKIIVEADLWFDLLADYRFHVMGISGGPGEPYPAVYFKIWGDGSITHYNDPVLGQIETGRYNHFKLILDIDNQTYSLWLDGESAISDYPFQSWVLGVNALQIGTGWIGTSCGECDGIVYVDNVYIDTYVQSFVCGDANSDQTVNVSDAVYMITYIFKGGTAPDPLDAGDANCDGTLNIGDGVHIINYVFKGGPEPCCP